MPVCKGHWQKSTLISTTSGQVIDDGDFDVKTHTAGTNKITGKHKVNQVEDDDITGTCVESPAPHLIVIDRLSIQASRTVTYQYKGTILKVVGPKRSRYVIHNGTYQIETTEKGGRSLSSDDGDWTAEKPIT